MSKKWNYPRVVAHRGGGHLAPENTLAALRCGMDYGFDMVEFDAKLSKDNQIILLHDDSTERTSNHKGLAAEMDLTELLQLDVGAWHSAYFTGEPIPTLENIARFAVENDIICNIEIKPCVGREKITGELVAKAASVWFKHAKTPPLLSSFSDKALEAAYHAAPKLPRAFLCETYDAHAQKVAKKLACVAINIDHASLDKNTIKKIHKDGYAVCAWTVNAYSRAKELLAWGCDTIITDELERIPASL